MTSSAPTRVWRPGRPVEVARILRQHRRGAGDPTQVSAKGTHWRATVTPCGPATLAVDDQSTDGAIRLQGWGPGRDWVLDQAPELLGEADDWTEFRPRHRVLAEIRRRDPHLRMGRTGRVLEALVPAIIEQKVTGKEAFAGFRSLVRRHGTPAPGPAADLGLMLAPDAASLRAIPSWEWLHLGIDPARSRAVVTAARHVEALERIHIGGDEAERRLRSLPGVGVWTSAEVRRRAWGDPDAVSYGDFHVARDVGWVLEGELFDDAALAAYLAVWRGDRGRVPFLIASAGLRRPRHGPRMAAREHLPRDQFP